MIYLKLIVNEIIILFKSLKLFDFWLGNSFVLFTYKLLLIYVH